MWPRKPEMPHGSLRERRQGATRKDRGWGMGPSLLEEASGSRAGWQGGGRPGRGCRRRMGSSCCQPARLQPDLPPKLRRAIFSLEHGKLPAFPPFLSDLLPAWPPNLFPFLPPSPIISDFRMFALAPRPPARSLHGGYSAKKKKTKNAPSCKLAQTHRGRIVFFLL